MSEEEGKRFKKLPPLKIEEVRARAQALLDDLGLPPYSPERLAAGVSSQSALEAEAAVVSEFVFAWLPQLTQREKEPK